MRALAPFVPQLALIGGVTLRYWRGEALYFGLFLLTALFVAFNKVCTVQYFVWYMALLPLCLPRLQSVGVARAVRLFALWLASMGAWLGTAYLLEFQGINTFAPLWLASIVFFIVNIYILCVLIAHYDESGIDDELQSDSKPSVRRRSTSKSPTRRRSSSRSPSKRKK